MIPAEDLVEAINVDRLSNIIRVVDGNHTASAGDIADGIADSGYLYEVTETIAARVQLAAVTQAAKFLKSHGQYGLAAELMNELAGDGALVGAE
jgi:hypothetical protein